ncbi:MAG: AMP-binding protein, partial [Gammaproteobacteria bacterium]
MEKIWLKNYPADVPADISMASGDTLVSMLEHSFREFADRPAFACMGKSLSYGELERESAAFGAWLQNGAGLKPGTRVAIMLPNILQYPVALFGALRAGMVVVNVNPLYTARELKHQLVDSGAEAIVILANFAHVLQKVIGGTALKQVVVTEFGDLLGWPKSTLVNFALKRVKKMVPGYRLPGHRRLNKVLAEGAQSRLSAAQLDGESLAFLQYTGGTTGPSKGAMLSHRSVYANVLQMSALTDPVTEPGREVVITALPLYHIYALVVNCMCFVRVGGLNVLIPNPRDVPGFVAELKKWDFTAFFGVNTLYNALVHDPGFSEVGFGALKMAGGGGMAVQRAVAEKWHSLTGHVLLEGYGLTECSPVVAMSQIGRTEVYTA